VGLSQSAFYQPKTNWAAKDAPVVDALDAILADRARWGFWRWFTRVLKASLAWNHKPVNGVYCDIRRNMKRWTKSGASHEGVSRWEAQRNWTNSGCWTSFATRR